MVLEITFYLLAIAGPAVALKLEQLPKMGWLNPVITCYLLGITFGLLLGNEATGAAAALVTDASIPLAIPLLLFGSDLRALRRLSGATLLGFGLAMISVGVAAAVGSQIFHEIEVSEEIAGMLVGVYTGGTPNMVAIGQALEVPEESFVLLNASDVVLGAAYLVFLVSVAKPLMSRIFPPFEIDGEAPDEVDGRSEVVPRDAALGLLLSGLIVAVSAGLTMLAFGELSVAGVILGITTGGIAASFVERVRELRGTFETGSYLILVFCVAIGARTDLEMLLQSSSTIFLYTATVMGGAIALHFAACRLFELDVDTTIITSTAAVYGPPFVPLVAGAIGNRQLILPGLAVGILGYAAGNYLGIGLTWALTQ